MANIKELERSGSRFRTRREILEDGTTANDPLLNVEFIDSRLETERVENSDHHVDKSTGAFQGEIAVGSMDFVEHKTSSFPGSPGPRFQGVQRRNDGDRGEIVNVRDAWARTGVSENRVGPKIGSFVEPGCPVRPQCRAQQSTTQLDQI